MKMENKVFNCRMDNHTHKLLKEIACKQGWTMTRTIIYMIREKHHFYFNDVDTDFGSEKKKRKKYRPDSCID